MQQQHSELEDLRTQISEANRIVEKLTSELRLYKKGSKLLYGYPKISYFLIKLGLGKKFMDGYSEGKTITEILKKKKLLPNY